MDFRKLPDAKRWDRLRPAAREELPEPARTGWPLLPGLALYLLAAAIIGLPLVFPAHYLLWLGVDTGLAVATGWLLACWGR
jgi:hypothetical protein